MSDGIQGTSIRVTLREQLRTGSVIACPYENVLLLVKYTQMSEDESI